MFYVRLAILAAFVLVGSAALWFRGEAISAESERDKARSELAIMTAANKTLERTIDTMEERYKRNDELLTSLFDTMTEINDNMNETSIVIAELREVNEDVKAYMAITIPDDLRRLLNNR